MSRKRSISTDMSTDSKLADLSEYGLLPLLLYTWAIPHMDDWGRMTGEARQFKLLVCPALDLTVAQVDEALQQIADVGLWHRYEVDDKRFICIDPDKWFKYQSYINKKKRTDDSGSNFPAPQNTEEHQETPKNTEDEQEEPKNTEDDRETPQNTVSPSPSPTPSPSLSPSPTKDKNIYYCYDERFAEAYQIIERHFVQTNEVQRTFLTDYLNAGMEVGLIQEAVNTTKLAGESIRYLFSILKNCFERKILTQEQFKEDQIQFQKAKENRNRPGRTFNRQPVKPTIPIVERNLEPEKVSEDELERARELARRLDANRGMGKRTG